MTQSIESGHYAELPIGMFPFRVDRSLAAAINNAIYRCVQQTCRVCGCSELDPCEEGCWWVEKDLCSSCHGQRAAPLFHLKVNRYQHIWVGHRLPDVRGRRCRVLKSHHGKSLIEFADGKRMITMRGNFRKAV